MSGLAATRARKGIIVRRQLWFRFGARSLRRLLPKSLINIGDANRCHINCRNHTLIQVLKIWLAPHSLRVNSTRRLNYKSSTAIKPPIPSTLKNALKPSATGLYEPELQVARQPALWRQDARGETLQIFGQWAEKGAVGCMVGRYSATKKHGLYAREALRNNRSAISSSDCAASGKDEVSGGGPCRR